MSSAASSNSVCPLGAKQWPDSRFLIVQNSGLKIFFKLANLSQSHILSVVPASTSTGLEKASSFVLLSSRNDFVGVQSA